MSALEIAYVSTHATAEQDFVNALLEILFSVQVYSYGMKEDEADADWQDLLTAKPALIVLSTVKEREGSQNLQTWSELRSAYPETPIIWLAAWDTNFFPVPGENTILIETMNIASKESLRKFIQAIYDFTHIRPKVEFF